MYPLLSEYRIQTLLRLDHWPIENGGNNNKFGLTLHATKNSHVHPNIYKYIALDEDGISNY